MNAKSLGRSFADLPARERAKLLAAWMHALTIDARDTYIPGTQAIADPVRLRGFNELQHRIAGHLLTVLNQEKAGASDDSFIEMMCEAVKELHAAGLQAKLEKMAESGAGNGRGQRRAG